MEYQALNKVYVKSKNSTSRLNLRYLYTLLLFIIIVLIRILIFDRELFIPLIISLVLAVLVSLFISIIINLFYKHNYINNSLLTVALLVGLLGFNIDKYVLIGSIFVASLVNIFSKNIKLSASLYGLLIISLYNLYTDNFIFQIVDLSSVNINSFILGNTYYLSPLLSIIIFIYLFNKKSIKYNIYISYLLTFFSIVFLYVIFKDMSIKYFYLQMVNNSLLFLSIYALCDYTGTPTIKEGQIVYGMILGTITGICRFIIADAAVIISLLIGEIFLAKRIELISYKLKYNQKLYFFILGICLFLIISTIVILIIYV